MVHKLMDANEVDNWYIQGDAFFFDLHNLMNVLTGNSGLDIQPELGNIDVPTHLRVLEWLVHG